MALRGADGDALVQRMQELELAAAQEEPGEVKTLTEAEERALPSRVSATMELNGDVGMERWARRMQKAKEEFAQHVEDEKRRLEQMVEAEKRRVEEELAHFKAVMEARRAPTEGWAALPPELLEKVFEVLQEVAVWRTSEPKEGGLAFSQAVAVVREVCAGWQAVHDTSVKRLMFKRRMTDEAVDMLVRRFPAVTSVELMGKDRTFQKVTDQAVLTVCSQLPALTSLDLCRCENVTDVGVRAASGMPLLVSLDLGGCDKITDEAAQAASSMPALTALNLSHCHAITDVGVRAVSGMPLLVSLNLSFCNKITDVGVRALSSLPALTHLDLRLCDEVTAAGVQALRSTTASPNLVIKFL